MLDKALKARFCKDKKVNINLFDEPYFTERLELLDKLKEYQEFEKLVTEKFDEDKERYFAYYNELKDKIINYIKASSSFTKLNSCDMKEFTVKNRFRQGDIYKIPYIGKRFISIDMKKANFAALVAYGKLYDAEFNEGSLDWNLFMSRFTDIKYFYDSKYIRQVVFGNCNPSRQITFEKYLMNMFLNVIKVKDDAVISFCNDEIILDYDKVTVDEIGFIREVAKDFVVDLEVEIFKLGHVDGTDVFIKEIINKNGSTKREIKCANPVHYIFVKRMLKNQEITDNDRVFYSEYGRAVLDEVPEMRLNFGEEN